MAPSSSSQKGPGKKAGASAIRQQQQQQQQRDRSRNTTPSAVPPSASLPPIEDVETETLDLRFELFRNLTYEDMVDPSTSNTATPDSKSLDGIISRLQKLGDTIEKRGLNCDRGMRLLAKNRKARIDELAVERGREEERRQKEADEEDREQRKSNKKKRKATENLAPGGTNIGTQQQQQSISSQFCISFFFFFFFFPIDTFCVPPNWNSIKILTSHPTR